jgi:hypothetical protein
MWLRERERERERENERASERESERERERESEGWCTSVTTSRRASVMFFIKLPGSTSMLRPFSRSLRACFGFKV